MLGGVSWCWAVFIPQAAVESKNGLGLFFVFVVVVVFCVCRFCSLEFGPRCLSPFVIFNNCVMRLFFPLLHQENGSPKRFHDNRKSQWTWNYSVVYFSHSLLSRVLHTPKILICILFSSPPPFGSWLRLDACAGWNSCILVSITWINACNCKKKTQIGDR